MHVCSHKETQCLHILKIIDEDSLSIVHGYLDSMYGYEELLHRYSRVREEFIRSTHRYRFCDCPFRKMVFDIILIRIRKQPHRVITFQIPLRIVHD